MLRKLQVRLLRHKIKRLNKQIRDTAKDCRLSEYSKEKMQKLFKLIEERNNLYRIKEIKERSLYNGR